MRSLDDIRAADAPHVGGKALNSARLKQAGFPVPEGFVLTTAAMGASLEIPDLNDWLSELPANALLAVRSSATDEDDARHSFAGIYQTRLNVTRGEVLEAIQSCWHSVASQQANAYRQSQHLRTDNPQMAVLVQRMVPAVVSGVAFTVNPITQSEDEIVINSAFGLGDALVSGQVDPDEFRIRKSDRQILMSEARSNSASLSTHQLNELVEMLLRVERHYGSAQDVEWCHDGSRFWILQSRPVTAGLPHKTSRLWTRANAREVLPELPSPMTIYAIADGIEESQRRFQGRLMAPASKLGRFAQVFYGRLYFNVDQIRHACRMTGVAPAVILRSMGHEGPISAEDEVASRPAFRETLRVLADLARMLSRQLLAAQSVRKHEARIARAEKELDPLDIPKMSDRELWEQPLKWIHRMVEEMQLVFTLTGVSIYEQPLRYICERVGMPYERLAYSYLAAGEKSVSSAQAFDLLRLALIAREETRTRRYFSEVRQSFDGYRAALHSTRFLERFDFFLKRYGHRGHYESDIAMPRYNEDPSALLFAIQQHVGSPEAPNPDKLIERQNLQAVEVWNEFIAKLKRWQRRTIAPLALWLLRRIKQFYLWRELCRSNLVRTAWPLRLVHLELARRFVARGWIESSGDYFFLTPTDAGGAIANPESGPALASVVAGRKSEWQNLARIDMPLLMREADLPAIVRRNGQPAVHTDSIPEWSGLCISPGCVEGEVIVLNSPAEFSRMKRGAILVTTATDPSWTPLFTLASGVIVEIGGILSHASTVAREYGLPAIANVKNATRIFKDGNRIRLDATNGVVTRV